MTALLLVNFALAAVAEIDFPKVLDDRLQLQLVAAEPDVVTPTGIAVDAQGRVLVIESHTHFRPKDYQGPPADRILLLDDFDPVTGKARQISVFFEGTTHTMNLAVFHDGSIYVATRMEIFRLRDKDGDGKADERRPICHLETPGNYPHNGLSGFAFDFAGNVYFGFGENLGADYKLIGSDGKTLAGGGEGGNIYCCDREGKNLRRLATGFWNPFHLGFDAFGRLFAVDNDPDSRPPCRLLHIIEGGDYGFRFRNGRKGVHPFTAWNGELPGTLPMVSGTGEAPSAVLAYESDNLPDEYRGDLLVTSWGDHRLERYHLKPRGTSFSADMTPVLRGDQNFRPVGLALAPDGSLFMSDWVDKSYPLHGKGRVWRLSAKNPAQPSRPTDTLAALASPHGPWREAAARKLKRSEAIAAAKNSPSDRARSLAGRATFGTNPVWSAKVKMAGQPGADVDWRTMGRLERFSETIARLKPAEFEQAAKSGELLSKMLAKVELTPADNDLFAAATAFDPQRYRKSDQPLELRLASLLVLGFDSPDTSDLLSDPFVHSPIVDELSAGMRIFSANEPVAGANAGKLAAGKATAPTKLEQARTDFRKALPEPNADVRLAALTFRRAAIPAFGDLAGELLQSSDDVLRLIGVLWIGEAGLTQHRPKLAAVLQQSASNRQLFECALAAMDLLDGKRPIDPKKETPGEELVVRILLDPASPVEVRRFALRTLRPDHEQISTEFLTGLLADRDSALRLEAIRTIRQRPDNERWTQLRQIAANVALATQERCEALLGLSPGNQDDRKLLLDLAAGANAEVSDEALRSLRGFDLTAEEKGRLLRLAATLKSPHKELAERALLRNPPQGLPSHQDAAAWLAFAAGDGNAQAGERIFYHPRVGMCFRCHEYEGRGYTVGPDLLTIRSSMSRERLLQSIVDPSREIAPQFTSYTILAHAGELLTGIHVGDEVDGRLRLADQNGRIFHIHPNDIDRRQPSTQSIMPEGLADNMTSQELKDLLAFLLRK
jgi:putative membrane-bound dehydrogenase-like protein